MEIYIYIYRQYGIPSSLKLDKKNHINTQHTRAAVTMANVIFVVFTIIIYLLNCWFVCRIYRVFVGYYFEIYIINIDELLWNDIASMCYLLCCTCVQMGSFSLSQFLWLCANNISQKCGRNNNKNSLTHLDRCSSAIHPFE